MINTQICVFYMACSQINSHLFIKESMICMIQYKHFSFHYYFQYKPKLPSFSLLYLSHSTLCISFLLYLFVLLDLFHSLGHESNGTGHRKDGGYWSPAAKEYYDRATQCFIDQYNNYLVEPANMNVGT